MELKHSSKTLVDQMHKKLSLKNSKNDEIEKEAFDDDNNFIDYFMVIGVKPEIYKNSYLYNSNSISDINDNLIPQIITKFPKIDKKHIIIENSIIQQIFPHGFNAIESETKPENQFYSVILDNQLYSATYTNKFIACLLIYENIKEYEILNEKYRANDELLKMIGSNSQKDEEKPIINNKYQNYYIPKCLCLVSVYPAFNRFQQILNSLYNLVMSNKFNDLYIDRIIEKLVLEIPKLPHGLKKIYLYLPDNNMIDLTEKKMNDLPYININLSRFFDTLDFANILDIFRYFLFETKLLFFSSKLYDLTNSIMSILSLVLPFKYQFQIVSVLPKNLYHFIETISPYIFGINESYDSNFFKRNKIDLEDATICIIDIDRNKYFIRIKNEKRLNKDYPPFPKNLREKIEKKFNKYKKDKDSNNKAKQMNNIKDINKKIEEENNDYQLIFYNFMISLLKDYPRFIIKDYGVTKDISMSIKDMIDLTAYANSFNVNERDFYNKIFSTQMFIEFIYKRMMPKNYNEKVEVLFFEEKIREKNNEKSFFKSKDVTPNILITSHEYDYDNQEIIIDCSSDIGITDNVYNYIIKNKQETEKLFLKNGYDIDIDENNKLINFKYHIFPCLLSEKFFSLNYEYYNKPELYYTAIDEINLKIMNKSNLQFNKGTKELITDEGNDIYLCYLIIWSLALWYTDKYERESRFLQMIEVIERVQYHDIQIFELLFKALVDINWSDKDIILLYKKFIHLNLNPTWKIFSMVSKIIKKKANAGKKKELLSQETKFSALKTIKRKLNNETKNSEKLLRFRSRTLKTKSIDDQILSEDVIFYGFDLCKFCKKNINLINLCSNLSQLKTQSFQYKDRKSSFVSVNSINLIPNLFDPKTNIKKEESEDLFQCPTKSTNQISSKYSGFKLRFHYGLQLFNSELESNKDSTSKKFILSLMSPSSMKSELLKLSKKLEKENKKFDVDNFKLNNKRLFWNLIWYLQLNEMDISFMLPYSSELQSQNEAISDNLKALIEERHKPEENINIENMVKNKDMKLDFLLFNKDSLEGQSIDNEEIKNEIFNKNKNRYEMYDLFIQKIFRFHFSDKKGMTSYLSFNNYSENIGYNEYPTQFKEVPDTIINYSNQSDITKKNDISKDSNDLSLSSENKHSQILGNVKNESGLINKNFMKLNTENYQMNKYKINQLMRPHLIINKNIDNNSDVPNNNDIINKEGENNKNNDENKENENNEEDIDLLSKFKEIQKKEEKDKSDKSNLNDYKNNQLSNNLNYRKSTLKAGILGEDNNENNMDSIE